MMCYSLCMTNFAMTEPRGQMIVILVKIKGFLSSLGGNMKKSIKESSSSVICVRDTNFQSLAEGH